MNWIHQGILVCCLFLRWKRAQILNRMMISTDRMQIPPNIREVKAEAMKTRNFLVSQAWAELSGKPFKHTHSDQQFLTIWAFNSLKFCIDYLDMYVNTCMSKKNARCILMAADICRAVSVHSLAYMLRSAQIFHNWCILAKLRIYCTISFNLAVSCPRSTRFGIGSRNKSKWA